MFAPAGLPDALVGLRPVVDHPVDEHADVLPRVEAEPVAVFVGQVERIDHLAVDVELQLSARRVADANRRAVCVAGPMSEFDLVDLGVAVEVVQRRQRGLVTRTVAALYALDEPLGERVGFGEVAELDERVQRERGVADPDVSIVPVAFAADHFGETRGPGRHDPAGRPVRQELEGQRRPFDVFAPPAVVGAGARPGSPVVEGALVGLLASSHVEFGLTEGEER